jgi:predicted aspartyl protease
MAIIFYSLDRAEIEIECVVDTGFEGFLTLPPTGEPFFFNASKYFASS